MTSEVYEKRNVARRLFALVFDHPNYLFINLLTWASVPTWGGRRLQKESEKVCVTGCERYPVYTTTHQPACLLT
jgi:hypothetical protein